MKIIIVGMGRRGIVLADLLATEGHDVVVVDSNKQKVESVTDRYSVSGVVGSGVSKEVLLKAGADTADVVIALSPIDEVNLMTCMIAKKCGTRYAAARIFQPGLSNSRNSLAEDFGIDYLINPKLETAAEIADHLREKRAVLMNLEQTNKDISRRLIDFLSGVAYAQDGKIKRVAANTYIITPYNVDLMGDDLMDELETNGVYI